MLLEILLQLLLKGKLSNVVNFSKIFLSIGNKPSDLLSKRLFLYM